jgi:SAM-dependent methyltransferase
MPCKDDGSVSVGESEVKRYRSIYKVGRDINVEHVVQHERLESSLTARLLESSAETRWEVFEAAYSTLYRELPWLNVKDDSQGLSARVKSWSFLIPSGARIYEVGSGKGELLNFLASNGCFCVATEITRERGATHLDVGGGVVWRNCDGVNLGRFEGADQYDFVVSTQVIEHLHPDDVEKHLREARAILRPGGQYIFDTPHASGGPHDLSKVFNLPKARYMHLHEYTWIEVADLLRKAGYSQISAVFALPRLCGKGFIWRSEFYLRYMMLWDWVDGWLSWSPFVRKIFRRALRVLLVPTNIWVAASK